MPNRKTTLFGIIAFACVVATYEILLPGLREGRVVDVERGSVARTEPNAELVPGAPPQEPSRHAAQTRDPDDSHAARDERAGDAAPALPPAGVLADLLSQDSLWHHIDLSDWQVVDTFARSMEAAAPRVLGATPADAPRFAALLAEARSTRVRQVLLVTLGVLGPSESDDLGRYLVEPGLTAASAYALGRLGSAGAVDALLGELRDGKLFDARRDALWFGLAQVGPSVVPMLVEATEGRLAGGAGADDALPLSFVRNVASRDALADLAREHALPGLRVAAIRGWVEASRASGESADWLETLVADEAAALAVRVEAMRGLASLESAAGQELAAAILARPDAPTELLVAALDATAAAGVPDAHVERIASLALGAGGDELREAALRTLATAAQPAADRALAALLPRVAEHDRAELLLALIGRGHEHRPEERGAGEQLAPELLDAVAGLLGAPGTDPVEEHYAMQVLAGSEQHRPLVRELAWKRYAETQGTEHDRRKALMELAPLLGEAANQELTRTFLASEEFVPRVELAATLISMPGNLERESVVTFLRDEILPYLRNELPAETGATLAYVGPRPQENTYAIAIANLFGRFGEPSDVPMLDELAPRFLASQEHWPASLRNAVHRAVSEAAARAADLIAMRTDT